MSIPRFRKVSTRAARRSYLLFSAFLIAFYSSVTEARFGGMSQQMKSEQASTAQSGYLYLGASDSDPIIDYDGNHGASGRPDFLYSPDTGPRVVEFYAPWCPHVRAFIFHRMTCAILICLTYNFRHLSVKRCDRIISHTPKG